MSQTLLQEDLERRIHIVINRLGFLPSKQFLEQVPYWKYLVKQIDESHPKGLEGFFEEKYPEDSFDKNEVDIPSSEQKYAGALIAERGKLIELSEPGTRKTISALSAIVPIREEILPRENPDQKKLKTFVTCPGYILPRWVQEIERLFKEPNIVVITRENREKGIKRAEDPDTDFVLVGYDMTFRQANGSNGNEPENKSVIRTGNYFNLFSKFRSSEEEAYEYLANLVGDKKISRIRRKGFSFPRLLNIILDEEEKQKQREGSEQIITALRKNAFGNGLLYYAIIDEFHNIVNSDRKRAQAIAGIAKPARWLNLISGTGIGNTIDGLAWAAYLVDFVDDPNKFISFIRGNDSTKKVRAFISTYGIHPIKRLSDVDPLVREPVEIEKNYDLNPAEMDLFVSLINTDLFNTTEKYLLLRYLVANPQKLLPENFQHLNQGDEPLFERVNDFYSVNPGLEQRIRDSPRSRIEFTKELVGEIKKEGKKVLVACEYRRGVTKELESALNEFGAGRIDQEVSSDIKEIKLTPDEVTILSEVAKTEASVFYGTEKFRSDLSGKAKRILSISPQEIYGMSDREKVIQTFATDPDQTVLVSTRVLREGVELREAEHIIKFEDTTVPYRDRQFNGRTVRSGQRSLVTITNILCNQLRDVEMGIRRFRGEKQDKIDSCLDFQTINEKDLREWIESETPERSDYIKGLIDRLSSRNLLSIIFNNLEGSGSEKFSEAMKINRNAELFARLYNHNWETSYSGVIANLTRDIIHGIERRRSVSLERILDAACGPLAVSRSLRRPTTAVDMVRYQIEFGIDACEDNGIRGTVCYIADVTNLKQVVPFDQKDVLIFEPGKEYPVTTSIQDKSQDLVVASLIVDLLDRTGRYNFLREAHRVIDDNKYLMIVVSDKKLDEGCRPTFIQDVESCGFNNFDYFTGTYHGRSVVEGVVNPSAYVIVAQKVNRAPVLQPELRLKPELRIENPSTPVNKEEGSGHGGGSNIFSADYFVKVETDLDLTNVQPEGNDYGSEITRLTTIHKPETIKGFLDDISGILGE